MTTIPIDVDAELVALLRQGNRPVQQTVCEVIVLERSRRGTLSSGKAAELLAMTREAFIRFAWRLGIPSLTMTEDEWVAERRQSAGL
jgi:hypothetical protein